jgi:nicotinamidase/pyrazinamidase
MAKVVIVTDMQRGFMVPEGTLYCGDAARDIIPRIRALLEDESAHGSVILFTVDTHQPDDAEFAMWPAHCVAGTSEVEIIPELAEFITPGALLHKQRYSAFFGTGLADRLAALNPDQIIVCGVCTDICVLHTVTEARERDYSVWVPSDCVATFDAEGHRWALKYMAKILGATVAPSAIPSDTR